MPVFRTWVTITSYVGLDNGSQFISTEFKTFMQENGVKNIRCAPYHPSPNGAAERFIQLFEQAMKACEKYQSTPHSTTNAAPCILFLKRQFFTLFDLFHPDVEGIVASKQADRKLHHNEHAMVRE